MSFIRVPMALMLCNSLMFPLADCAKLELAPYRNSSSQPTMEVTKPDVPQDSSPNAQNLQVDGDARSPVIFDSPAMVSSNNSIETASTVQDATRFAVPIGAPTTVKPQECQTAVCNISVVSVSVIYWPQNFSSTDCLSTISILPTLYPFAELSLQSPSIGAVFYSVTMSNGCGQVSTFYDEFTASFPPGALSTLVSTDTAPEPFNFAHLPCPPASLWSVPGQPYQPRLAIPIEFISTLRAQNPKGWEGCTQFYQVGAWDDPPAAMVTASNLRGPGKPGRGHRPARLGRDVPANAHRTATAPARTPGPKANNFPGW